MELSKKTKAALLIIFFLAIIFLPVCYALIKELNYRAHEAKISAPNNK